MYHCTTYVHVGVWIGVGWCVGVDVDGQRGGHVCVAQKEDDKDE